MQTTAHAPAREHGGDTARSDPTEASSFGTRPLGLGQGGHTGDNVSGHFHGSVPLRSQHCCSDTNPRPWGGGSGRGRPSSCGFRFLSPQAVPIHDEAGPAGSRPTPRVHYTRPRAPGPSVGAPSRGSPQGSPPAAPPGRLHPPARPHPRGSVQTSPRSHRAMSNRTPRNASPPCLSPGQTPWRK